ncbi:hypothetical protein tloyanaT_01530 [Thalassotalea loyana]|uniref:Uncharacterized protein n=1 Tax=Thalassotalea loyana TaxID=280483 RepID=A0ABQ6HBR0_9GAMM|nr:hypothetical protein tloyanaT_01530 [Thalassotalea loyana]
MYMVSDCFLAIQELTKPTSCQYQENSATALRKIHIILLNIRYQTSQ